MKMFRNHRHYDINAGRLRTLRWVVYNLWGSWINWRAKLLKYKGRDPGSTTDMCKTKLI